MTKVRGIVVTAVLFGLFSHGASGAQLKRPVALGDLEGVASSASVVLATLDVSPDGERVAIERDHRLRVFSTKTGRVLHELGAGLQPLWAPGGARLAFYSVRSGALQLWLWDFRDGSVRQLTDLPGGIDVDPITSLYGYWTDALHCSWSPDGTKIAFVSRVSIDVPRGELEYAPLVLDNTTPADLTLKGVFKQFGADFVVQIKDGRELTERASVPEQILLSRLFVADIETRTVAPMGGGTGTFFHPAWSPNGHSIAIAAVGMSATDTSANGTSAVAERVELVGASRGELALIDVATGQQRILVGGDGLKQQPHWNSDGSQLAFLVSKSFTSRPLLRVVDPVDGKTVWEHEPRLRIFNYEWARDRAGFVLAYVDPDYRLGRLALAGGGVEQVAVIQSGVWAQDLKGTVVWAQNHAGPDFFSLNAGQSKPRKLLSWGGLDGELQLGTVETITWRNARGDSMQGKLLYPVDYAPGKRYPMIVDVYPLTSGSNWMHPMGGNQTWAAAGYLVLKTIQARAPHTWVNCSSTAEFCNASKGPGAWDTMFDDVMTGVDEVIRRGIADSDRMCVYGHSNGGGVAEYLVTQTDRFKCAVVAAPVMPSWVGSPLLHTQTWGSLAEWTGIDPLDDPAAYVKLSAMFRAKKIHTPMLLAVGDLDGGFLLGSIEMYNAMRFASASITFVRYPDQGHLFNGPALQDFWTRQMRFFGEHLKAAGGELPKAASGRSN